jgi:methylase of polypeptide subunit release factors
MRRLLWRSLLRLRYLFWQRRHRGRTSLEIGLGFPLVVLPEVFNPVPFRTTPVILEALAGEPLTTADRVFDLGTGTGALAVAAARRGARVVAVDVNPAAVRCARINAQLNQVDDLIDVRFGDLFAPAAGESFDLVLSNPPFYRGEGDGGLGTALHSPDFAERLAGGLSDHLSDRGRALVVLSTEGDETGFLAAFHAAGLQVSRALRRDLVSEVVTVYRLTPPDLARVS